MNTDKLLTYLNLFEPNFTNENNLNEQQLVDMLIKQLNTKTEIVDKLDVLVIGEILQLLPKLSVDTPKGVIKQKPSFANFAFEPRKDQFNKRYYLNASASYNYRCLDEYDTDPQSKKIIKKFLNKHYEYDTNKHVAPLFTDKVPRTHEEIKVECKNDSCEPLLDTTEGKLNLVIEQLKRLQRAVRESHARAKMVSNDIDNNYVFIQNNNVTEVNLPMEAYYNFSRYVDDNHSALVDSMDAIYGLTDDIGMMVIYHGSHDTYEEAQQWNKLHSDNLLFDTHTIESGKVTYLGPHEKNKIDLYNKDANLINQVFEKQVSDYEFGKKLVSKRIKDVKIDQLKKFGPDSEQFIEYKKMRERQGLLSNQNVLTDEDKKEIEELERKLKETEFELKAPENSVEIKTLKPKYDEDGVLKAEENRIYINEEQAKTLNMFDDVDVLTFRPK